MKRLGIMMISVCALVLGSCQKENATICSDNTLTVTASIDNNETKTYFDATEAGPSYPVYWATGDKIKIWNTDGTAFIYQVKGTVSGKQTEVEFEPVGASFTGTFAAAYYPAETATAYASGKITAEIPAEQICVSNSSVAQGSFPMIAEGTVDEAEKDLNLTFHNLFGVLCLKIKGDGTQTITRIDVLAENNVLGTATIDATTGAVSFDDAEKTGKYLSLVINDATYGTVDATTAKEYYIAVPTGKQSFEIAVSATEGSPAVYPLYYKKSPSLSIKGSVIKVMPELTLAAGTSNFKRVVYPDAFVAANPVLMQNGVIFASENCGCNVSGDQIGLMYQFGMKPGINPNIAIPEGKTFADVVTNVTNIADKTETTFVRSNYYINGAWGATDHGEKNLTTDPCPEGWRVPLATEIDIFAQHYTKSGRISKEFVNPNKSGSYLELYEGALCMNNPSMTLYSPNCRFQSTSCDKVRGIYVLWFAHLYQVDWQANYYATSVRCVSEFKDH